MKAACQVADDDMVELLLGAGAIRDVNTPMSDTGGTPLIVAAYNDRFKVASIILDSGGNIHARTHKQSTALLSAKTLPIIKLLLDAGACLEDIDNYGCGVLHRAVQAGCGFDVIDYLIAAGANPALADNYGRAPSQHAIKPEIIAVLDRCAAAWSITQENSVRDRLCASCGAVALKKCNRCKVVHFCNADCQRRVFRAHKADCLILAGMKS